MTVKEIIHSWLKYKMASVAFNESRVLPNHLIETELPDYGKTFFDIRHTPGTYSRAWRDIRQADNKDKAELGIEKVEWEGFIISEEKTGFKSKEKHFRIRRK